MRGTAKFLGLIFFQKYFLKNIFWKFEISLAPPPFFSTRYLIKCYIIVYFGRRSTSDAVAGGELDVYIPYTSHIHPIKDIKCVVSNRRYAI